MYYQVMSFSHKHCAQEMREKLAFSCDDEKKDMLDLLVAFDFIHEAFIISTCNRVDIVLATRDNFSAYHAILGLMAKKSGLDFYALKNSVRRYDDEEAVQHLFSVVSSLESLVIGESQITGQVREGYSFSYQNNTAAKKLNRLLSYAVKCAAEVRNVTNISQNPISISSVAVAQAHEILADNMAGMTGIVVGAGEMAVLAAKHLLRAGCDVVMLGRDKEKVAKVAQSLGENVKADSIEHLEKYLNRYRLLFSATSAKHLIIKESMIDNESLSRLWFDMAIPRDIEDIDLEKLALFRIDDLRNISQSNHALREEHALQAMEIVSRYKENFFSWLRTLSVEPVIKQMRMNVHESIEKELDRAIKKGFVSKADEENMRKMCKQMFNHFLHEPTQNLRKSSRENKNTNCIESIKKMFNINTENVDFKVYKDEQHSKRIKQ